MADPSQGERAPTSSIEGLIGLAAPFLDVLLGFGERISRIAEPTDYEYYPIQEGEPRTQLPEPDEAAHPGDLEADGTILSTAEEIGDDEEGGA